MSETRAAIEGLDGPSYADTRRATGRLGVPTNSPPPRIRFMDYDAQSLDEGEIADTDELRPYAGTTRTTWIDIQGLGDEARLRAIAALLGIHELALADAVNLPQRAKAERYPGHLLVVIRTPLIPFDVKDGVPQVCVLMAENYVVTFQERYFGFFDRVRDRLREPAPNALREAGPGFLVHALIDVLIDHYYPVVDGIAEELDDLEDAILDDPSPELVARLHHIQRRITLLRRVARPQVEALHKLAHGDRDWLSPEVRVFLGDVHDHAQQIMGRLDSSREIATDIMSAVLASLGHRQNEVMKVLTLVGSIFIPLTFIAGIYGMNFEHMPELKIRAGYPIALGVMGIVAVVMFLFFRIKGWIGGTRER